MAASLTLTNSIYLTSISLTASNAINTPYTIVPANNTQDRRIYGMSVVSTSASTESTCKVYLSDGTNNYQMGVIDIPANSGNSTTAGAVDIFSSATFANLFTYSMCDNMSVFYFNLPKTWSLKFSFTTALTGTQALTITTFGEIYDALTPKYTSAPFLQVATFSSATGTNTVNLLSSSTKDRRIYGMNATSTDTTARTITINLNDGTNSYQIYTESILANSGASTTVGSEDIFYDALIQGLFVRTADCEGVGYYFNLPAGWSIQGKLTGATTATINIRTFGDTYG